MRRSVLLVPTSDGGLWSARSGGVRWICGFTDEPALARFALHHGPGDRPMEYAALLGARMHTAQGDCSREPHACNPPIYRATWLIT